jgi:hypothetical protein
VLGLAVDFFAADFRADSLLVAGVDVFLVVVALALAVDARPPPEALLFGAPGVALREAPVGTGVAGRFRWTAVAWSIRAEVSDSVWGQPAVSRRLAASTRVDAPSTTRATWRMTAAVEYVTTVDVTGLSGHGRCRTP